MKVVYAPYTLFVDRARLELSLLSGGMRMAMTGEEASLFWGELGSALKLLYADCPEKCPPALARLLLPRRVAMEEQSRPETEAWSAEAELQGVIEYARRPVASPDLAQEKRFSSEPDAARPADTPLGRLVRDVFKASRPVTSRISEGD